MKPFADLTRFINPRGIAVVASPRESSQGRRLYENLALHSTAPGEVYPVNPAYEEIGGRRCWPSISDLPAGDIDVALVMVNARARAGHAQAVRRGIPYAVVMTSGFPKPAPAPGTRDRRAVPRHRPARLRTELPRLRERARPHRHDLLARLQDDLNSGGIGLATQGGGLGRNLLQGLSHGDGVGLWFSAGNEVDLEIPDFVAHMAADPRIRVIALLMEGVKDGRRLTAALQLAASAASPWWC